MQKNSWYVFATTMGGIGYLPAPGTMATVATLPIVILLSLVSPFIYFIGIGILYLVCVTLIKYALLFFHTEDPSPIVLDEFVGTLITFLLVPISWHTMLIGFILFRLFDISKIGLRRFERIKGPHGIMLDDVVAGLMSCFALHIINYLL